ncbi:MAG TPA: hypothetical protein VN861_14725 [Candidatus Acidoferrales bacterium]|nr:hypothetical protein [Candidatus Acidoferrales bacterium]
MKTILAPSEARVITCDELKEGHIICEPNIQGSMVIAYRVDEVTGGCPNGIHVKASCVKDAPNVKRNLCYNRIGAVTILVEGV